jgi:Fe2+ or Zn2+ uptake regulation protein
MILHIREGNVRADLAKFTCLKCLSHKKGKIDTTHIKCHKCGTVYTIKIISERNKPHKITQPKQFKINAFTEVTPKNDNQDTKPQSQKHVRIDIVRTNTR